MYFFNIQNLTFNILKLKKNIDIVLEMQILWLEMSELFDSTLAFSIIILTSSPFICCSNKESQTLTAFVSPPSTTLHVECLLGNPEQTAAVCSLFVNDGFL